MGEARYRRKQSDTDIGISQVELLDSPTGKQHPSHTLVGNGCASEMQGVESLQFCQMDQCFVAYASGSQSQKSDFVRGETGYAIVIELNARCKKVDQVG